MQCPLQDKAASEVLVDYCSRKTDAKTTALLERHIADCAACRTFAEAQKSVWKALDCWDDVEISADFNRRLYAKIDALEKSSWWTRVWSGRGRELLSPFGWRPAMPLATACLTLALAFLLYSPSQRQQPVEQKSSQQVMKELVDLDQVEKTLDDIDMLKQLSATSSARTNM